MYKKAGRFANKIGNWQVFKKQKKLSAPRIEDLSARIKLVNRATRQNDYSLLDNLDLGAFIKDCQTWLRYLNKQLRKASSTDERQDLDSDRNGVILAMNRANDAIKKRFQE